MKNRPEALPAFLTVFLIFGLGCATATSHLPLVRIDFRGIQGTGFVWNVMKKNPHIIRGLKLAGFRGGWLETAR